jgi:transcriptional regulator with XRE-family HTH domain
MVEENIVENDGELPLEGVGQKLRRSRTEQGMSIEQVAQETRIAQRHLEMIEQGNFSGLPARTYAFGFTKTYARMLGLDERALAEQLRGELSGFEDERPRYTPGFEPGDPAKVPPRAVVWIATVAAVLFLAGVYVFYARFFAPGADPAPLVAESDTRADAPFETVAAVDSAAPAAAEASTTQAPDQVVFTALEEGVWVSFYEASGRRLEQKLMSEGERFVVPAEARDPRVWTGRPDAFAITVGGEPIAKLADEEVTVRDVPITAQALRARDERQSTAISAADETASLAAAQATG